MDLLSARMTLIRHAVDNLGYFYLSPISQRGLDQAWD